MKTREPCELASDFVTVDGIEFHYALDGEIGRPTLALVNPASHNLNGWAKENVLNLLMVTSDTHEIIGATGYPRLDWNVPRFEIGYWCRSDRTGRGYVSEATWALARHAFESLAANRVELRMDEKNRRSWAVAERLGFRHEATLRNEVRARDGSLRDTRIYGAVSLGELTAPAA